MRAWASLALLLSGCTLPLTPPAPQPAQAPWLRLIGSAELPAATEFGGSTVGGLSGIDYSPEQDQYLLISDDRGNDGPARVYSARIRYDAGQLQTPQFTAVHHPRHASGEPFAPWWRPEAGMDRPDAEAVRWLPGGTQYLWSSEGDFSRDFGPQLRVNALQGDFIRAITLPTGMQPQKGEHGPRGNGTLEGLALTPDGCCAWLAMELPLKQDGEQATPDDAGAPVRMTQIELASGRVLRQIAYQPEPVPYRRMLPGPQLNGVSEILMEGRHHLLVLERSYSAGRGFGARLYRIDTRTGSDTQALDALTPANHQTAPKQLIGDLAALGIRLDNIEGMSWGPRLPDGGCVLLFVADDNFNPAEITQFIAARYLEPPGGEGHCPASAP